MATNDLLQTAQRIETTVKEALDLPGVGTLLSKTDQKMLRDVLRRLTDKTQLLHMLATAPTAQ